MFKDPTQDHRPEEEGIQGRSDGHTVNKISMTNEELKKVVDSNKSEDKFNLIDADLNEFVDAPEALGQPSTLMGLYELATQPMAFLTDDFSHCLRKFGSLFRFPNRPY